MEINWTHADMGTAHNSCNRTRLGLTPILWCIRYDKVRKQSSGKLLLQLCCLFCHDARMASQRKSIHMKGSESSCLPKVGEGTGRHRPKCQGP